MLSTFHTYVGLASDRPAKTEWVAHTFSDDAVKTAVACVLRDPSAIVLRATFNGETVAVGHAPGGLA